jgi:hypothetical protein
MCGWGDKFSKFRVQYIYFICIFPSLKYLSPQVTEDVPNFLFFFISLIVSLFFNLFFKFRHLIRQNITKVPNLLSLGV